MPADSRAVSLDPQSRFRRWMQGEMRNADLHYSILDCNIEAEAATGRTARGFTSLQPCMPFVAVHESAQLAHLRYPPMSALRPLWEVIRTLSRHGRMTESDPDSDIGRSPNQV